MKKIILLLIALLITGASFAQKKKKTAAKTSASKTVLTKNGNLTAELLKGKDAYRLYLLNGVGKKADTVSLERFAFDPKSNVKPTLPEGLTITAFSAKGTKLHNISWTEKTLTEVPDKKEDATRTVSQIWDLTNKVQLHSNVQTATKITEILYLDKLKGASQTSEKMRNEGFNLTISAEGDLVLKNRTQENRMSYDAATGKFVAVKSAPQTGSAAKPAAKKKK
ncbi:hypothetical protein [Flavobacterium caeni]|uniref:LPS export ABC transporter periplasmic protein LptC n=1 Tax=Flavobacterium caeni TaxID=490189 RepID=A0A1G5CRA2_9FLAO|nr:hypothetical protein [Flavobacterium caeni]SCY04894.1 hypothetical protein SAMN02927903_00618 [Flavobacterium caeni]